MILLYKDKENIPNIISFYKNTEDLLFLLIRLTMNHLFFHLDLNFEENIDLKSLYNKAVFSIVMEFPKMMIWNCSKKMQNLWILYQS